MAKARPNPGAKERLGGDLPPVIRDGTKRTAPTSGSSKAPRPAGPEDELENLVNSAADNSPASSFVTPASFAGGSPDMSEGGAEKLFGFLPAGYAASALAAIAVIAFLWFKFRK